jgi:3-oxoacyl-[acyl-carrier-protein] synthase-3
MEEVMTVAGVQPADVDWFVPHQANRRILEGTARKLGIRADRIVMTLDRHGNTSAASIPLAFDLAVKDGRIRKGELILFEAMGGGFTWGAVLARF